MLQKIKKYFYSQFLKKNKSDETREKKFVNYDKAESVLILFESSHSEKNPDLKFIQQSLLADKKRVTLFGFVDKKEISSAILPNFRIFNKKDFNWLGKPNYELINYFKTLEFDLIIDLTINEIIPLQYVLGSTNASFKIGMLKTDFNPYDFGIDLKCLIENQTDEEESIEPDAGFLFNHLIFYLKNIKTND